MRFITAINEKIVTRAERSAERASKLTAGQHVLHLLLTVFTAGLWLPVWIWRAWRGNPRPPQDASVPD